MVCFDVSYAGKSLMFAPKIWITRKDESPGQDYQPGSNGERHRGDAGLTGLGHVAGVRETLLSDGQDGVNDRGYQNDEGQRKQPGADRVVNRKRNK